MSLENTPAARISALAAAQKTYFRSGATLSEAFRRTMLRRLDAALANWEKRLCDALWTDLHKSPEEAFLTEISIVRGEIRSHLRHLGRWMRPAPRPTPLKLLPAKSRIVSQPLGQALIVAPWNYPVQLLLNPLVGAISAGCTALLKPSPYTPNVAEALEGMIAEIYDEEYVAVVQGDREVNTQLFDMRWDLIFFTGSPALGRIVMTAAARNLTPVVLELGGKSPSIVDRGADIEVAARRIAWGKTLNAGQTCIAPDYLLIHRSLQDEFSRAFARALHRLHGDDAQQSPHYGRLVNDRAFGLYLFGVGNTLFALVIAEQFIVAVKDAVIADAGVFQNFNHLRPDLRVTFLVFSLAAGLDAALPCHMLHLYTLLLLLSLIHI